MLDMELEKRIIPDVLTCINGDRITNEQQWIKRRAEIVDILCSKEYGFLPPPPLNLSVEVIEEDRYFCAGKVTLTKVLIKTELEQGDFAFPIYCAIPNGSEKYPAFIHINFRDNVPDMYMPTEEICDNGFAVISFCYKDVTADCDDGFSSGLAGMIYKAKSREPDSAGKIALWAWAASRVMDYVQTLDNIDKNNIAVVGHSRLGKTALLAGGLDERFAYVISNNSGCSGAAITRNKTGEHIGNITGVFPYWFCKSYFLYGISEASMPFDQHFLLALTAPRKLYVASAELDSWADPYSEYLSCAAASKVWGLFDKKGFICPDRLPNAGDVFQEGDIAYHLRPGSHYLSRYDWQRFIDFIRKSMNN